MSTRATIVGVAALAIAAGCAVLGNGFRTFRHSLAGYHNVKLIDDRHEVGYRLGAPAQVVATPAPDTGSAGTTSRAAYFTQSSADPGRTLPSGKSVDDFADWTYPVDPATPTGAYVMVHFGEGSRVELIRCVDARSMKEITCDPLAGIFVGATEETVLAELGAPRSSRIDGIAKELWYPNLGVEVYLTKGIVYSLGLSRSNNGEFGMFLAYLHSML